MNPIENRIKCSESKNEILIWLSLAIAYLIWIVAMISLLIDSNPLPNATWWGVPSPPF